MTDERRTDEGSRDRIDELEVQYRRFARRCLLAFSAIGVATALALAGYGMNARKISRAQDATFESRRAASIQSCEDQNVLRVTIQRVLGRFHVSVRELPKGPDGRSAFARDNCTARARTLVPERSKP